MRPYIVRSATHRIATAWVATAVCDGLFSSFLSAVMYGSPVARLWQGVASVLLGASAFDGGARTVVVGVLLHAGVALVWTVIAFAAMTKSARVNRVLRSPMGTLKVAAVYGPVIWIVMSFLVIPQFSHTPLVITGTWWVRLFAHILVVALPMVALLARGAPSLRPKDPPLSQTLGPNMNADGSHIDPDGQINSLLTNTAYQYVSSRVNAEWLPSGAYEYIYTVRRKEIDEYIARHNIVVEEYGEKYHWLRLRHEGDVWLVGQYMPPEKSPGIWQESKYSTYESARSELFRLLLRNAQTNIPF